MKCDIVLISWNHPELLEPSVEHIIQNTHYPYRLIIVDNASDESETINYLESLEKIKKAEITLIRNPENLGFVRAVNQGLRASNAPYVCICNNDILPGIGWLTEMVEFAEKRPDVGLLNPICGGHREKNLRVNEYARLLSSSNRGKYMEMNQCQGFCMLVKRELIRKLGYLDERFDTIGFDDTDYSMRAHLAGYKSVCVHSSYVYHSEHKSFDKLGDRKKVQAKLEERYFQKWPRHKRVAIIFTISKNTTDDKIANVLRSALFLAREWCWVNLMIFGQHNTKDRINTVREKMGLPLHQNIKFNYLQSTFKIVEITVRILERSFGSKKRKKYDTIIYDNVKLSFMLNRLGSFHKCTAKALDFNRYSEKTLKNIIDSSGGVIAQNIKCDIILPVCDQYEFTKKCIESILKNTDSPYRLIIINNGTNPDTKCFLDELDKNKDIEATIVHNSHNIGWVKALNKGMDLSGSPYLCFQNDDTIVTHGWLRKMIDILKKEENFGLINPTWEGKPPGTSIEKYNAILEKSNRRPSFMETDWCRGFSVVLKRAVIEKIGNIDEIYGLAYFDDVDYSVTAIEAGFLPLRALNTYVYHHRNVTFFEVLKGKKWNELHEKNKLIYYKKWGKPLNIAFILNKKTCSNPMALRRAKDTIFYLARKQHHIYIWSPCKLGLEFAHTNIKQKNSHPYLLRLAVFFDLYINKKKRTEKRYNAVFHADMVGFADFARNTVDNMKEETKESIDVTL